MLYKTYRESILGGCQSKRVGRRTHCTSGSNSNGIFCIDGFRPGRRDPFVSAKGPKTIDAPSGLNWRGRTPVSGGRANSLRSNKARQLTRASLPWASRQASDHVKRPFQNPIKKNDGSYILYDPISDSRTERPCHHPEDTKELSKPWHLSLGTDSAPVA